MAGLYQAFVPWTKTGIDAAGHGKPTFDLFPLIPPFLATIPGLAGFANLKLNWYWVRLMLDYEWFALAGLLFSVRFFFGGQSALRYLAIYSLGVLFAYSIVPYKTPWCIISIMWPFLFLGAALIEFVAERFNRLVAVLVSVPLFAQAGWKSYDLNLVRYDNPKERYVYVQTLRDYHKFVDPILKKAKKIRRQVTKCQGSFCYPVIFLSRGSWEISQYRLLPSKDNWPEKLDADFIAVDGDKAAEVEKRLKDRYFTADFMLRDGMDACRAYFRYDKFQDIFPGRKPEFEPGQSHE